MTTSNHFIRVAGSALLVVAVGCDAALSEGDDHADRHDDEGKADGATLGSVCLNDGDDLPGWPEGIDLGFRYESVAGSARGRCVNDDGEKGLNPDCIGQCGDLADWDLRGFDFRLWPMVGASFKRANLRNSKWGSNQIGGNARGAVFDRADLYKAWFQGANLDGASFREAKMGDVVFSDTRARGADFRDADMRHVWWAESSMMQADFRGADMTNAWNWLLMNNCFAPGHCMKWARFDATTELPFTPDVAIDEYKMIEVPANGAEYVSYTDVPPQFEGLLPITREIEIDRDGKVSSGFVTLNVWDASDATFTLVHRDVAGKLLGQQVIAADTDPIDGTLLLTEFDTQSLSGTWQLVADGDGLLLGWSLNLGKAIELPQR